MPNRRHTPDHGTRARYVHRYDGCRCPLCTRANAEYLARYRARRAGNDG